MGGFGKATDGSYISSNTLSFWTELSGTVSEKMEWGLFAGFSENGGFGQEVTNVKGFQLNSVVNPEVNSVANVFRVSPRVGWKSGKMLIGTELEYTSAQYGTLDETTGDIDITSVDPVSNIRFLLTAIYKF